MSWVSLLLSFAVQLVCFSEYAVKRVSAHLTLLIFQLWKKTFRDCVPSFLNTHRGQIALQGYKTNKVKLKLTYAWLLKWNVLDILASREKHTSLFFFLWIAVLVTGYAGSKKKKKDACLQSYHRPLSMFPISFNHFQNKAQLSSAAHGNLLKCAAQPPECHDLW